jgi:hypothetical protein
MRVEKNIRYYRLPKNVLNAVVARVKLSEIVIMNRGFGKTKEEEPVFWSMALLRHSPLNTEDTPMSVKPVCRQRFEPCTLRLSVSLPLIYTLRIEIKENTARCNS